MRAILLLGISFLFTNFVSGQTACGQGGQPSEFGSNANNGDTVDGTTGLGILQLWAAYEVTCCGVAESWVADFLGVTGSQAISFQVWRPVSGTTYELVGENDFTISANGQLTNNVPTGSQISIRSGDRFGWYTSGTDIVAYNGNGNKNDDNYLFSGLGDQSAGAQINWGTATVQNDRSYGIQMNVGGGAVPSFSNVPGGQTISNNEASTTTLVTLTVADADLNDVLTTVMTTSTTEFSFDTSTLILTVATLTTTNGEVELVFEVNDYCGQTATGTYTVTIYNDPPTFYNSPSSIYLSEDTLVEVSLFTILVNDSGDTISCAFAASVPNTYPFEIRLIPSTTSYGIYSQSTPGFDYDTLNVYTLTVDCTDTVTTVPGTYLVYLIENQAPNITNLQGATTLNTSTSVGTTVFTVTATDAENDNLDYSITCNPSPCIVQIFDSGQLQLNTSLVGSTIVGYDIFVTVSDGKSTDGPKTLTITIADINDAVTLSNLPLGGNLPINENTALGTTVYQVSFSDNDASQTHTWTMTSSPAAGLTYFSIDSNGLITASGSTLNYEALASTTYTLSVTVSDPVTSDTQNLVIDVVDVNEAPSFAQTDFGLTATEGSAGASLGTPSFGNTDPDTGDSTTLTMDCGTSSSYFIMSGTTGEVTLQSDYDLDTGTLASTVICGVNATDTLGLTATATLTISLANLNDNTPQFVPDTYSFFVSYYADSATVVGTTTATDGDIGSFGTLTYSINQTTIGTQQFSVDNNGVIYVQLAPDASSSGVNYSESHTVTLTATDGGGLSDTATVIITISDTTTTTATTTTNSYMTFFDDPNNLAWFVPCMMILFVTFCITVWTIYTCHGQQGCGAVLRKIRNRMKLKPRLRTKPYQSMPDIPPNSNPNLHTVRHHPPPKDVQPWRNQRMKWVLRTRET